ncbi:kinase-like domain-containing protein [Lasiosphaeria ovina]|uniref:Kinase-like domain-containing protein n=1 Tax=Lasiosphaeria ovina TaxID=92902 RepID=A0AAE0JV73_9PEZI|nr:kinase-like domain-containing protein [Lasiosphaeria ovina]
MPPSDPFVSDLVRDSKIDTEVLGTCTKHVFYDSGPSAKERRVRREERWLRAAFLGQGAYGTVYLERFDHQQVKRLRAVKEVKKCVVPGEELDYIRELEAIVKFSNPKYAHCFVRSDGWYELDDSVFITMEYLENGDLQKHLMKPLPESEARQITAQVREGLEYMHDNGFVHRDLKPGNIMVVTCRPEWFVKIADFGISKRRQQDVTTLHTMQRGTFGFAAPEALGFSKDGSVGSYTFSVDMWSLGAVAYKILTSTMAFENVAELFKYGFGMNSFPLKPLEEHGVSQSGQDFMIKLMSPAPENRPSASEAANHEWMSMAFDSVPVDSSQA